MSAATSVPFIAPLPAASPSRVAASVTLYNSLPDCIDAIATYQNQVEQVYLIDNSDQPDLALIEKLTRWSNVQYISNGGNKGIAASLNRAAQLAIAAGFDFLLTMDDDTSLPAGAMATLLSVAATPTAITQIGIVSGSHSPASDKETYLAVPYTMTSGNLLNLALYQQVGPFRDDFFIDHVDHEYGLRLNQAGFQLIELPGIQLQHQLGERKASGWGAYQFVSHAPIRGYYMVRNGWVLARAYPAFRIRGAILIGKEWVKTLLFEDQKSQRLRLLWQGFRDAWRGRLGKFSG